MDDHGPAHDHVGELPVPALTEDMRERARRAPGSWLYAIDPAYDPQGAVPPHAIRGAWPVDDDGVPGAFTANPGYRSGQDDPEDPGDTDSVAAAMRAVATGRRPETAVVDALRDATVYLPAGAEGDLVAYRDETGHTFVELMTDPRHAPSTAPLLLPVGLTDLLGLLSDETDLRINTESDVSLRVTSTALKEAFGPAAPEPDAEPAEEAPGGAGAPHAGSGVPPIPVKGRPPGST